MHPHVPRLVSLALLLPLTLACNNLQSQTEAQTIKTPVIESSGAGYKLEVFDNSETFSQADAINSGGQMVGLREVVDKTQTIFSQEYFFIDGSQVSKLPQLEGFTNIEVLALSDNGLAVGFASRPIGHPEGSLTAIVWDSSKSKLTKLNGLPGDRVSHAQDISADGQRITGYSTGGEPPGMRPCVWTWDAAAKQWNVEGLSVIETHNPFLMSGGVIISPDGNRIASCITVEILPNNQFDSSLFVWERKQDAWERVPVSDDQMHLKDMNNQGEIVAALTEDGGRLPCHVDLQGKITRIDLLKGDVTGEALGINDAGTVVGFSSDPQGPDGGPQAFVWKAGKTEALPLPATAVYSAAKAINAQGQIAGLVDVPVTSDEKPKSEEVSESLTKTLAFRWTPVAATPSK